MRHSLPRRRVRAGAWTIGWLAIVVLAFARASAPRDGRTSLVSATPGGALAPPGSEAPHVSGDGRFVVFTSAAAALVEGDGNGQSDVFVRDTWTARTERVSLGVEGAEPNGPSFGESVSRDGRWVVFSSLATNLVTGDTNGVQDVFLRDRELARTERVSVASGGEQASGGSVGGSISADGRLVVFESDADDLVTSDGNEKRDVFLRDRAAGQTRRISVASDGTEANGTNQVSSISPDGSRATFSSYATNLVPDDTNERSDVFVRDLEENKTWRVSVDSSGSEGDGTSWFSSLSADGRVIAFQSLATNLVPEDSNERDDIFVHDLATGETSRISVDSEGKQSGGPPETVTCRPRISRDARWVTFHTYQDHLVGNDTNRDCDVFLHDRERHLTIRASLADGGAQGNKGSEEPALCDEGRFVAFRSSASNLLGGDGPQVRRKDGGQDVFLRERFGLPGTPYCFGDGSGEDCPCANSGAADEGCANSTGHGAFLTAMGSSANSGDGVSFVAARMPPHRTATLYVADSAHGEGVPFEDGLLCIEGGRKSLGIREAGDDGIAQWGPGLRTAGGWSAGQTRRFQVWYEDAGGPCDTGHNQSNAYEIVFAP